MTDKDRMESIIGELEYSYMSYGHLHDDYDHGIRLIKKALEKQIPKKPVIKLHTNRVPDEQEECYCPYCDEWLTWEYTRFKYCYNCGQRIAWSEVEE